MTQTVTTPGSGLVFVNTYSAGDTQQYINCIVSAEQTLETFWTNSDTINATFDTVNNGATGDLATNGYNTVHVTYAQLEGALALHASSPYAVAALNSLPSTDPNPAGGADWTLPVAYARMLGLTTNTPATDVTVTLNIGYDFSYGQDVINSIEHELSEGAMGRVGGLGDKNSDWSTMDLFRYSSPNVRDYSDGRDGLTTYFSYNGTVLSSPLSFNNEYNTSGVRKNTADTSDFTERDVFGTGSVGAVDPLSQTDLEMMDVLGWDPSPAQLPPPNPTPSAATTADLIMSQRGSGEYEIFDIGNNAVLAACPLSQVGFWQFVGLGGFDGADTSDMILRDSGGKFKVYDVNNNNITNFGPLGQVGLEWTVSGFGDFSGNANESDMLMRDSNNGVLEVYDIRNNQVTFAAPMGQVGLEWSFAGFGDFSTRANETDMLMRNNNTGAFEVFDINNNQITFAAGMGQVGLEWSVAGFGDFSGNANETDMLMQNNNTGAFEVFDISNNRITFAAGMGQVGLEWQIDGIAADPLGSAEAPQLAQAMASYAPADSAVVTPPSPNLPAPQPMLLNTLTAANSQSPLPG